MVGVKESVTDYTDYAEKEKWVDRHGTKTNAAAVISAAASGAVRGLLARVEKCKPRDVPFVKNKVEIEGEPAVNRQYVCQPGELPRQVRWKLRQATWSRERHT